MFGDPAARARLNAVVHPRVRERTEEIVAAAAPDAIVVQDIPLLVETASPAAFALVVVVHADPHADCDGWSSVACPRTTPAPGSPHKPATRSAAPRLTCGSTTTATRTALDDAVTTLWHERLVPFEANARAHCPVILPAGRPVEPNPRWAGEGARLVARVARAAGAAGRDAAHVGPTAVPGVPAEDVVDVQLLVEPIDVVTVRLALDAAGFPRLPNAEAASDGPWRHAGTDPGRPVRVLVYADRDAYRAELLHRDSLRTDAATHAERRAPTTW